jgi:hypothetical protein
MILIEIAELEGIGQHQIPNVPLMTQKFVGAQKLRERGAADDDVAKLGKVRQRDSGIEPSHGTWPHAVVRNWASGSLRVSSVTDGIHNVSNWFLRKIKGIFGILELSAIR